jgi:tetratricopeptide (TPR) repeat protein
MFFIIPLVVFIGSLTGIFWIIARKFVYLKKLTPEILTGSEQNEKSFWAEFFPEIAQRISRLSLHEYRVNFLAEFEKILRKLRLLSLRIDTFTNSLIHRVRKTVVEHEELISGEIALQGAQEIESQNASNGANKDPREEEQKLIIEIARNPKDSKLYKKLGNIYLKIGEWNDAYESFKKALELDPTDDVIRNKLEKLTKKIE